MDYITDVHGQMCWAAAKSWKLPLSAEHQVSVFSQQCQTEMCFSEKFLCIEQ